MAAALNEIAETAAVRIAIEETAVPVEETVRGACEILGFDPLHVANEGRFIAIVPEAEAGRALAILKAANPGATRIGEVSSAERGIVTLKSQSSRCFGSIWMSLVYGGASGPFIAVLRANWC